MQSDDNLHLDEGVSRANRGPDPIVTGIIVRILCACVGFLRNIELRRWPVERSSLLATRAELEGER